jgi:hypothetical protein
VGFLDRLFRRRSADPGAPAPTRDDTLSSTYVPPPTPDVQPAQPDQPDQPKDDGGGDGGDGGEGNGGGGGD